jgi:hypothetical protein
VPQPAQNSANSTSNVEEALIVGDETEAVAAVKRVSALDRRGVRKRFEERFTTHRMVNDYLNLYRTSPRPKSGIEWTRKPAAPAQRTP